MKLVQAYKKAIFILNAIYKDKRETESSINFLLSHLLNKNINLIKQDFNKNISKKTLNTFFNYIDRALMLEPVQYITGKCEFYGIEFLIKPDVLIPRFDSEVIIEEVLKNYKENFTFLDLCCGSACLGISILLNSKNSFCHFVDISSSALKNTKLNLKKHNLSKRSKVIKSDLFKNIKFNEFDFIISNPPYIKTSDLKSVYVNLNLYEPNIAFDGKDDGLYFYKEIEKKTALYLKKDAKIFLEIPAYNKTKIKKIFNNYKLIKTVKDLNKLDRALIYLNK